MRHAQIAAALDEGPLTAADIAARLYPETAGRLRQAAARNVLAHLIALREAGQADADEVTPDAVFTNGASTAKS